MRHNTKLEPYGEADESSLATINLMMVHCGSPPLLGYYSELKEVIWECI